MDLVLRATILYLFILFIMRVTGKRTLSELTAFDFVLLLLVAESTDNSIIGRDHALVSTIVVILTFVGLEIFLSFLKQRFPFLNKWLEGTPLIIVENGRLIKEHANNEKIDESDVLSAARRLHGIEKMDEIKYAILEKNGGLTIIPK